MTMRVGTTVLALLAATAATSGTLPALAQGKTKACFMYVGPVGDHGWSYQHDQSRQAVVKEFGDKVETAFVESVPEGPDAERVVAQFAQTGCNIVFTTSFGFMNPTVKVAERFPNVKFEHASGFKRAANVSTYNIKFHQGRYLHGLVAGKMTKTNTIGYIASFPIPEVVSGINAAYLGAKKVNPNVKFKIIWVSSWFDPGKESAAAKALIEQGADILMQHTDSPAPMQAAAEKGIYAFGQASDMSKFGPKAQLTASVDNWGPYVVSRVKAVMDGTWKSTDTWGGLKEGMLSLAPLNPVVPADAKALFEEALANIKSGGFEPFTGPIKKQDGSEFLKAGDKAEDKAILSMNFYVEGIDGTLPK